MLSQDSGGDDEDNELFVHPGGSGLRQPSPPTIDSLRNRPHRSRDERERSASPLSPRRSMDSPSPQRQRIERSRSRGRSRLSLRTIRPPLANSSNAHRTTSRSRPKSRSRSRTRGTRGRTRSCDAAVLCTICLQEIEPGEPRYKKCVQHFACGSNNAAAQIKLKENPAVFIVLSTVILSAVGYSRLLTIQPSR